MSLFLYSIPLFPRCFPYGVVAGIIAEPFLLPFMFYWAMRLSYGSLDNRP